jgi:hypothetical protein
MDKKKCHIGTHKDATTLSSADNNRHTEHIFFTAHRYRPAKTAPSGRQMNSTPQNLFFNISPHPASTPAAGFLFNITEKTPPENQPVKRPSLTHLLLFPYSTPTQHLI